MGSASVLRGFVPLLLACSLAPAAALECTRVKGRIAAALNRGPDCPSPGRLCLTGSISGATLRGSFRLVATDIVAVIDSPAPVVIVTADVHIHGAEGSLRLTAATGVRMVLHRELGGRLQVVGGDGRFDGAMGTLVLSGALDAQDWQGQYSGELCTSRAGAR